MRNPHRVRLLPKERLSNGQVFFSIRYTRLASGYQGGILESHAAGNVDGVLRNGTRLLWLKRTGLRLWCQAGHPSEICGSKLWGLVRIKVLFFRCS